MSKSTVLFDEFNTFPNANACRNHIHVEYVFEIARLSLFDVEKDKKYIHMQQQKTNTLKSTQLNLLGTKSGIQEVCNAPNSKSDLIMPALLTNTSK